VAEFSILTVCTGNIHRSPLAAALLGTWAEWYLPPAVADTVRVGSAGLAAPVGSPMGARVQRIAAALGADGSAHLASQITDQRIAESGLVLVATRRQRDEVLGRVPAALRKTFTIREAGRIASRLTPPTGPRTGSDLAAIVAKLADQRATPAAPDDDDVLDPQGLGDEAYAQMAGEEIAPLVHLATVLFGMPPGDERAYLAAAEDPAALLAASPDRPAS